MFRTLLLAATLLAPIAVHAGSTATKQTGISYGPDPQETVDVWTPPSNSFALPRPAVVLIHGGSCIKGAAAGISAYAQQIAQVGGYVVANINYRLNSHVGLSSQQVNDAQLVVRWLRANAAHYGVDSAYICLDGWSAGASIAIAAGASSSIFPGDRASIYSAEPQKVSCINENSGPTGMTVEGTQTTMMDLVGSWTPPFYISHGTQDPTVQFANATNLAQKLKSANVWFRTNYYNGGHILHGLTPAQQQVILLDEIAFFGQKMYF